MTEMIYSGRDNLIAMRAAKRYNAAIVEIVEQAICGPRVIDFGAGEGLFADLIGRRHPPPLCVESDKCLRDELATRGFAVADTLAALPTGEFDFAYTLNVLEHIEDDRQVLRDLRRCLRPGGCLFVFVPACPVLFGPMDRHVGHVRRYRKAELREKLDAAGFSVDSLAYFDSIGFLAALAHRMLARGGEISPGSVAWYDQWVFPLSRRIDTALKPLVGKNLVAVAHR